MKHILAAPFLTKFAFSLPYVPPPAVPQIVNVPATDAAFECSDVWSRTCSGTNSNGEYIYGGWTCGERIQYNIDHKLGRAPSMSDAIAQVLSECPSQCEELANNQCDTYVETNLKTISESDCSATWDATCTNVYGTWTCGKRVIYDYRNYQLQSFAVRNTYNQCEDQCEHISKNQCADFVESKLNEVQQDENDNDDYEDVVEITVSPVPLSTCEEAYDRVCDEGYGSYTCGERVGYVFEHPLRQNAYMNAIGENAEIADAMAEVHRQCPNQCREFVNNNCEALVTQYYAISQIENGSGSI